MLGWHKSSGKEEVAETKGIRKEGGCGYMHMLRLKVRFREILAK
jgi:hypothetical protein